MNKNTLTATSMLSALSLFNNTSVKVKSKKDKNKKKISKASKKKNRK